MACEISIDDLIYSYLTCDDVQCSLVVLKFCAEMPCAAQCIRRIFISCLDSLLKKFFLFFIFTIFRIISTIISKHITDYTFNFLQICASSRWEGLGV